MRGRLTIIIAVLEATVLLVMKLVDWRESKTKKPIASKVRTVKGHQVVNLDPGEYDGDKPQGETNAAYLPASGSSADEKIHEKE